MSSSSSFVGTSLAATAYHTRNQAGSAVAASDAPTEKHSDAKFLDIRFRGDQISKNDDTSRSTSMSGEPLAKARIDRWLWSVRQFKTRTLASDACRGGKIRVRDEKVKPSYGVKVGEIVEIQAGPITKRLKVVGLVEKRVGAKLVPEFMEDLTPPEAYLLLQQTAAQKVLRRDRGTGRPTKRDRREIERLFGED